MSQPTPPRTAIPLSRLVLCLDDDVAWSLDDGATCPVCAGLCWTPVSAWINRGPVVQTTDRTAEVTT